MVTEKELFDWLITELLERERELPEGSEEKAWFGEAAAFVSHLQDSNTYDEREELMNICSVALWDDRAATFSDRLAAWYIRKRLRNKETVPSDVEAFIQKLVAGG